jgi:hypothetical protein
MLSRKTKRFHPLVAEPNSESSLDGLKLTVRRVIRDESLDSLGFDVELANPSDKDFLYDPESFGVRIGDEVYPEAISDARGIVEAGKTLPAFFVVAGTATGGRNDLAVTNKFDIVMRQIIGERDSKASTQRLEPPAATPTGQPGSQEPALPAAENENRQTPGRLAVDDVQKLRKSHRRRRKSAEPSGQHYAAQPNKNERNDEIADQVDE